MKRTGPTNPRMKELISEIKDKGYKENNKFLISVAKKLEKPARIRAEVNVSKIERYAQDKGTVLVPGKVLGCGVINKKVTVSAFKFSGKARKKIEKAGGKCISIKDLVDKNPKGTGVKIMA